MKYTPNKIKDFIAEKHILDLEGYKPGPESRLVPVVQCVILKEIVDATIDSGCRVILINSY